MYIVVTIVLLIGLAVECLLDRENEKLKTKVLSLEMDEQKYFEDLKYLKRKEGIYFYRLTEIEKALKRPHNTSEELAEEIKKILARQAIS